jgi:hypothetical protein
MPTRSPFLRKKQVNCQTLAYCYMAKRAPNLAWQIARQFILHGKTLADFEIVFG